MKYAFALVGTAASLASAHSVFTTIYINDVSQGDGTCVRMAKDEDPSAPIAGLSSDDMACGIGGEQAVAYTCPAPAGAKLSFEWRLWADKSQPGVIDISHKGPCSVYAKRVDDMSTSPAAGPGWFKIWEQGYDEASGKWCVDNLIDANGIMSIDIPSGLPSGNYLFRPELLALHNANTGDPQFYAGCAQVQVQGGSSGSLDVPSQYSVSIPGYVKDGEPSVSFNIYTPKFPYPMPGPDVYTVPSSGAAMKASDSSSYGGATLTPDNCLIKEANWCGTEVADYDGEDACWKASDACYKQAQTCYDQAPATGDNNCKVWEAKCKDIQDHCSAGEFQGPPNKGQKLEDAEKSDVTVPAAYNLGSSTGGSTEGTGSSGSSGSVSSNAGSGSSTNATSPVSSDSDSDSGSGSSGSTDSNSGSTNSTASNSGPTDSTGSEDADNDADYADDNGDDDGDNASATDNYDNGDDNGDDSGDGNDADGSDGKPDCDDDEADSDDDDNQGKKMKARRHPRQTIF